MRRWMASSPSSRLPTRTTAFDFPGWIADINTLLAEYNNEMEAVQLKAGLTKLMEISTQGNLLLQYRLDNANLAAQP